MYVLHFLFIYFYLFFILDFGLFFVFISRVRNDSCWFRTWRRDKKNMICPPRFPWSSKWPTQGSMKLLKRIFAWTSILSTTTSSWGQQWVFCGQFVAGPWVLCIKMLLLNLLVLFYRWVCQRELVKHSKWRFLPRVGDWWSFLSFDWTKCFLF